MAKFRPLSKDDPDLMGFKRAKSPKLKKMYAERLLKANMALVAKLVNKYSRYAQGAEQEDLMQAGCIAFLRTLEKTDPRKPFSTLCAYWVRYEVSKCIDHSTTIYRPRGSGMPYPLYKKSEEILARTGRPATADELGVTQEKLEKWRQLPITTSLDADVGDSANLHDVVPNDVDIEKEVIAREDHAELRAAVKDLSPLKRQVIEMLFFQDRAIEEVAEMLAIDEDNIGEIAEDALRVLGYAIDA